MRNRIINGAMQIWQRGITGTTGYVADRWAVTAGTSVTATQSTDVPNGYKYSLSLAGTNLPQTYQRIESVNCTDLSGQSITLSFWAKQSVGAGAGSLAVSLAAPTAADNYTSTTAIGSSVFTGAATWTQYSVTFASVNSAIANGLQIIIYATATGAATFLVTGVQLEVGSVATPFERRQYGYELALCQRYYYRNTAPSTGTLLTTFGICQSTTSAIGMTQFPVTMRAAPTALEQSGTAAHYQVFVSSNVACSAVPTFLAANVWYATTTATTASGLTSNLPFWLTAANTAAYLGWSAEL